MQKILLIFISIITLNNLYSSPWIESDDLKLNILRFNLAKKCDLYINDSSSSSISIINLINEINRNANNTEDCIFYKDYSLNILKKRNIKPSKLIGIQTDADKLYLNQRGKRYSDKGNIYYKQSHTFNNFSYNLKVTKFSGETNFDDTYLAYKNNNSVYKIGKVYRWWSPSENTSLIMSNAALAPLSISIGNYESISFKKFNFVSDINYEIFISKLERDREIPNARLFGNRLNFRLFNFTEISLLRVAQFGGKDRVMNSDVLINMLSGKDNTNRNLDFYEQPGNQIAGIDLAVNVLKQRNLKLYAQYIGEDGLDPIIDDRWIGAIFPSKRFGLGGVKYNFLNFEYPIYISLEHINTDTGYKNVTYNHSLYKTGYRYKGYPLGDSMDTDSHRSLLTFKRIKNNNSLQITINKMHLNQNNSSYTRWDSNIELDEIKIKYSRKLKDTMFIDLTFISRDLDHNEFSKNLLFLNFEQRL